MRGNSIPIWLFYGCVLPLPLSEICCYWMHVRSGSMVQYRRKSRALTSTHGDVGLQALNSASNPGSQYLVSHRRGEHHSICTLSLYNIIIIANEYILGSSVAIFSPAARSRTSFRSKTSTMTLSAWLWNKESRFPT